MTGAVILVALIVLLVPELLSGPGAHAPTANGIATEEPLASYTFGLSDESHGAPKAPVAPLRSTVADGGRTETASSAAVLPVSAASGSSGAPPGVADVPTAAGSRAGSAPPVSAASSASSATPSRGVRHGSSASAQPAHVARAPAGWWVQLGSFSSRANADRLVQRLKAQGFGASIAEGAGSGRRWYRVRSGPEPDHAAAQALAQRLRDSGHGGTIVPAS